MKRIILIHSNLIAIVNPQIHFDIVFNDGLKGFILVSKAQNKVS
tara:strand:+ start:11583 stop:11714 length:132 start_codon:yes stop_codon:yes gene_type:complete